MATEKITIRVDGRDEFHLLVLADTVGSYLDEHGRVWRKLTTGEYGLDVLRGVTVPSLVKYTKREPLKGEVEGFDIDAFGEDIGAVFRNSNGSWDACVREQGAVMFVRDTCDEAIEALVEVYIGERDERLEQFVRQQIRERRQRAQDLREQLRELERGTEKIIDAGSKGKWHVLESMGLVEDRELESLTAISTDLNLSCV
jgi:hypothetical protein